MKPTILLINSSPKRNSTTHKFLNLFVKAAEAHNAKIELINLYDYSIPYSDGILDEKLEKLSPLQEKILHADGFVIGTPTYWFNVPGILKNFIDHLTPIADRSEKDSFGLEGKVAGFIVYSPEGGESPVLQTLALTFNHMGVLSPPYSLLFYRGNQDKWFHNDIALLARNMVQQITIQKKLKLQWDEY